MVSAVEQTAGADNCVACGSADARALVVGYDRMRARPVDYPYVRCTRCSLVRMSPLPAPEEIPTFYDDDYAPHVGRVRRDDRTWINRMAIRYFYSVDRDARSPILRAIFRALSGRLLSTLREPIGANRLLDVGCGSGALMQRYRALGWTVNGIEIDPRACAAGRAQGLDIHCGTVFDAPYGGREFDLILLSHVIEHVLDPIGVLRNVRELLAPGGILAVETPNIESLGFAWYGSSWFALDAPRHLMLFSPATLRLVAEHAGLRVHRWKTIRSTSILRRSHHYAVTQGHALPTDPTERVARVTASQREVADYRLYRTLVGPLTRAAAAIGRGETLEAELVR